MTAASGARSQRMAALVATLFVFGMWVWMLFGQLTFLSAYASNIPFMDDLDMAAPLSSPITAEWLWSQHNEHRLPVPRLVYLGLAALTGSDFRAGMYCQAIGLALLALTMIFAARRLRGSTSMSDAFFPLIWMHTGNPENLLMGFQLCIFLSALFVCIPLLAILRLRSAPKVTTALIVGTCAVLLPLCGGMGVTEMMPIVVWLVFAGWNSWRSTDPEQRRVAWWMFAMAAAASAVEVLYFVGLHLRGAGQHSSILWPILLATGQFLSLCVGTSSSHFFPGSAWFVLGLGLASLALLAGVFRNRPQERVRSAGIASVLFSIVVMGASIGWGRAVADENPIAGLAARYAILPTAFLCAAYFAWCVYGEARLTNAMQFLFFSGLLVAQPLNIQEGEWYGSIHHDQALKFERDLRAGLSIEDLADRHWVNFYSGPEAFAFRLHRLQDAGLPPFPPNLARNAGLQPLPPSESTLQAGAKVILREQFAAVPTKPIEAHSPQPILLRPGDRSIQICVWPEGELIYHRPAAAHVLRGCFGLLPDAWRNAESSSDGVHFTVLFREKDGHESVLFERSLEPRDRVADRDRQDFRVQLPDDRSGEVILRTSNDPDHGADMDWSYWSRIFFRQ